MELKSTSPQLEEKGMKVESLRLLTGSKKSREHELLNDLGNGKKEDIVIDTKAGEAGIREEVPRGQKVNSDKRPNPSEIVWGEDIIVL